MFVFVGGCCSFAMGGRLRQYLAGDLVVWAMQATVRFGRIDPLTIHRVGHWHPRLDLMLVRLSPVQSPLQRTYKGPPASI